MALTPNCSTPVWATRVVTGKVFIEHQALVFRSDATTITIPVEHLIVEWSEEGRIYFRNGHPRVALICTSDESHP